jgi:glycosyltransferase involved in cell wall biosynthesis
MAATFPVPLIYLKESRQGVHYARNHAAKRSTGELLYFTDDDMVAEVDLLEKIASIFQESIKIGTATGKVLPIWEAPPPDWILKYCNNGWLSLADYGNKQLISDNDPGIWSCHQAIKREVFFKAGGYNPENTEGVWIGDGETGLNIKIAALGYKFAYTPGSITHHIIPATRTTQSYLNKRLANQGNCDGYTEFRSSKPTVLFLLKKSFGNLIRFSKFLLRSIPEKWKNKDQWHMTRAYSYYYRSKSFYQLRLAFDKEFRAMVMKNDWLKEA